MVRPKVRIRFRKEHDQRLLGHHDLLRVWERLLRRAEVRPAQTEGFHKRPKIHFPSALAVGIRGLDEVVELEMEQDCEPAELVAALNARAPLGIAVNSCERIPAGLRFSQPQAAEYEIRIPDDRTAAVAERIERWREAEAAVTAASASPSAQESTFAAAPSVEPRSDAASPVDVAPVAAAAAVAAPVTDAKPCPERLPATVQKLELVDGALRMRLTLGQGGAVRPRDLLAWLHLSDLEQAGVLLTRTRVEVSG